MAKEFLGTGMAFPPRIDPATGRFALSSGAQSVKESIYLILMTQVTERLTRPSFGTDSASYVFMDMNNTEITIMKHDLMESILRQEPRVTDVDIEADIDYTLTDTNTRDNLVFPFYLNAEPVPDEEEDYYEPEIIDVNMSESGDWS